LTEINITLRKAELPGAAPTRVAEEDILAVRARSTKFLAG